MQKKHWISTGAGALVVLAGMPMANAWALSGPNMHIDTARLFLGTVEIRNPPNVPFTVSVPSAPSMRVIPWKSRINEFAFLDENGYTKRNLPVRVSWEGKSRVQVLPLPKVIQSSDALATVPAVTKKRAVNNQEKEISPGSSVQSAQKPDAQKTKSLLRSGILLYRVKPGECAYELAEKIHQSDWGRTKSMDEIIEKLVTTNQQAFVHGNPNELLAGSVLKIPEFVLRKSLPAVHAASVPALATVRQSAALAKHRLRMTGVGERIGMERKTTPVLQTESYLVQKWALIAQMGPAQVGWHLLLMAKLVNGTTTLSTLQVAMAIFTHNPKAFSNGNPLQIQAGSTLVMPTLQEVESHTPSQALRWWQRWNGE